MLQLTAAKIQVYTGLKKCERGINGLIICNEKMLDTNMLRSVYPLVIGVH